MKRPRKNNASLGILVSGLSGSGKSTALHALEDLGYQITGNLPLPLLKPFLKILKNSSSEAPWALSLDGRNLSFIQKIPEILQDSRDLLGQFKIFFLEASTPILLQRYAETRRQHPLANAKLSLETCIETERLHLAPLRELSHYLLDTSKMNIHQLKKAVQAKILYPHQKPIFRLQLFSFAYKRGLPLEADLILDARFLKNPYFEEELKHKTGLHNKVQAFVLKQKPAQDFLKKIEAFLKFLIPAYQSQGKNNLTLAIGCTGGQHRSVALVEKLSKIRLKELNLEKFHRDL